MRMMRRGPALLALLMLAAACNGGNGRAAPSTTEPPITLPPSATSSSTVATTTGSAGATTVSTTTAAPTTVDPKAAAEAEVRKAVEAAVAAFTVCLGALPHCDPLALGSAMDGPNLDRAVLQIGGYNSSGYAARNRDTLRFLIESVEFTAPDLSEAIASVCYSDKTVLYRPGAGPGGADVIVDDSFISAREKWTVHRVPSGWRVSDTAGIGADERTRDLCAHA